MTVETAHALLDTVRELRLLRPDQLATLTPEILGRFPDSKSLARELLERGWLTRFQLTWLVNGRGTALVLGGYHLVDRLGSGGMGEVFKAMQRRLNRVVALKVIRPDLMRNETQVRRFQREAQAAARLQHPNIVAVYDFDEANGSHFLAMEYVEGQDFGQIIKANGPLPVRRAADTLRQASLGLAHAHERGLVHRDIKPSNLLVDKAGVVKVLDMGLARSAAEPDTEDDMLTKTGTVVGTPDFMSPEQAKNSRLVGPPADLYSLGATFYYLLTARPLFEGDTAIEKLLHHQSDPPPSLRTLRPDVPPGLEQIFFALVAKRPEDRPPSAEEVAAYVEPFCHDGPTAALPVAALPIAPIAATAIVGHTPPAPPGLTSAEPFAFDGGNGTEDFADLEERPVRRRRGVAGMLVVGLAVVGFLLAVGAVAVLVFGRKSALIATNVEDFPPPTRPKTDTKPAVPELEPIERYVPEDAGAVGIINIGRALQVPTIAKSVRVPREAQSVFDAFHFDPVKQVRRYIVAVHHKDRKRVVIIAQCAPVETAFQEALGLLLKKEEFRPTPDRPPFPLYRERDKEDAPTIAVLSPTAVLLAADPNDAKTAIRREIGRNDRKQKFTDEFITESLSKFRPELLAWGAISARQDAADDLRKVFAEHNFTGAVGGIRVEEGKLIAEGEMFGNRPKLLIDLADSLQAMISKAPEKRAALFAELAKAARFDRPTLAKLTRLGVTSELPAERWVPLFGKLFEPDAD